MIFENGKFNYDNQPNTSVGLKVPQESTLYKENFQEAYNNNIPDIPIEPPLTEESDEPVTKKKKK